MVVVAFVAVVVGGVQVVYYLHFLLDLRGLALLLLIELNTNPFALSHFAEFGRFHFEILRLPFTTESS